MLNALISTISKTVVPNADDIALCDHFFEPISVSKNTILEEREKIPQHLYFIHSGFVRLFYHDDNGNEATTYISSPNSFITPFLSFINEKHSKENVESVTDCELLRIARPNLVKLIDQSDNFKKFSLIIFQEAMSHTESRANDLATLKAEQRYKKLLELQPEILQNVPVQYIASFLGIQPESLSRIRRQIIT